MPASALLPCSACPFGLGGLSAGWWAGAVFRRGSLLTASARLRRPVRLVLFWPLPRAYWPFGPLRCLVWEDHGTRCLWQNK
eukprot:13372877-Alexandrium_andersonii.AAC.1